MGVAARASKNSALQAKTSALEEKVAALEKQVGGGVPSTLVRF